MLEKSSKRDILYGIYFSRDTYAEPNMKTYSSEEVRDTAFDKVIETGIIEFGHEKIQVVMARKYVSTSDSYFNYELLKQRRKEKSSVKS
jgi:hypothetical protein